MQRMPKEPASQSPSFLQLSLPLYQKPFLATRNKVRGKNRKAFDLLQEVVRKFQIAIDRDEIQSVEAKAAIRKFLVFVQGDK